MRQQSLTGEPSRSADGIPQQAVNFSTCEQFQVHSRQYKPMPAYLKGGGVTLCQLGSAWVSFGQLFSASYARSTCWRMFSGSPSSSISQLLSPCL